ncbi:sigma 54 response regulator [Candidatus Vecturithrix granuli]|uniref:Sigma 54 response regulator n=1 Tax=Vecturithrix granuli TaxID=1499967 RepID=A0A081BY94_VECG1|nr:sigma 54 response regulator [Candidatus Vecturithrix granuli]
MKRLIAFFLGIFSALVMIGIHYSTIPPLSQFLKKIELQSLDYRMKYAKKVPDLSDAIKIVLVNDATNLSDKLAAFTRLITTVQEGALKPKVIGFNYRFDASEHEELISIASTAGNIYYGYSFQFQVEEESPNQDILPFRLEITNIGDDNSNVFEAQQVQLPSHKYLTTARGIGFVNTLPDVDGVFRRIPLFLRYQGNWYGSLSLLIAMEYLDVGSVDMTFYPGQYVEITKIDGTFMKIPVNQYGEMLIDFAYGSDKKNGVPFEIFSMENDVLAYQEQILNGVIPESLRSLQGAIVLVGSGGRYPIPLSASYPLIGIHANFINTILTNQFIRDLSPVFFVGVLVLLGMLTGLACGIHRWWIKILLGLLLAGCYVAVAFGVFYQFKLLLPILPVLLTICLTTLIAGIVVRHPAQPKTAKSQAQPIKEKKRKIKAAPDDVVELENTLIEIREDLDRKSIRLRSKIEEVRILQEQAESNHYDYSRQVVSLQKEIRAREIEIKGLIAKEEELRRQFENLPFNVPDVVQSRYNPEAIVQLFAPYGFVTNNDYILRTLARAEKLGKTSVALLIQGEPGTGKKLLAHIIRQLSSRHNRPMLEVICAGDMDLLEDDLFGHRKGAFPGADEHRMGFFRKVDEGTLVLEEIGNLSMEIQTRLIQTARGKAVRPLGEDLGFSVDVRIIATTSHNLQDLVAKGLFREDLYHYFSVFPLYLLPLRERKEDIPMLVNHFIAKYNLIHSKIVERASDDALNLLFQHQWPGNIIELEKVIERAIAEVNPGERELAAKNISFEEANLNSGITDPGMLNYLLALMDSQRELPAYQPLREKVLAEIQRLYCVRLLRLHQGNVKNASIDAGLKPETFKKMLSELMIDPEHYHY